MNKVDNSAIINDTNEFYSLGIEKIYPISSASGFGTGDLLDDISKFLIDKSLEENNQIPRFSVVGRPNAGKSSFINTLIGEKRNIVTEKAGTTRDSINTKFKGFGFEFEIIDTAGIRKKTKVKENLEFYSVMRSVRAIENSDVCIILFDVNRGF